MPEKNTFLKFLPLRKVDETTHRVYGLSSSEVVDSDKEIADYEATKAAYTVWSKEALEKTLRAGQEPSLGNIRIQHDSGKIGGKATKVEFKDADRETWLETEPVNDEVWKMLKGGFLTGYSQGGSYLWRKCNECGGEMPRMVHENFCRSCQKTVVVRYAPKIGEVSYVDRGANPDACFEFVRADGSMELRKFATEKKGGLSDDDVDRIVKALREDLAKGTKYLVPGTTHLPYTDESGKPNHRLMGAAWAALHGGYRGNKYEGPGREAAISRLKEVYRSEGLETPSDKASDRITELSKVVDNEFLWDAVFADGSQLDTALEKFSALIGELVKHSAATGAGDMNQDEIKKCAAALGITEDEFKKKYVDGDALEKGKKGLAALHAHLKKAMAHHEKMSQHHAKIAEMHKTMSEHHATMGDHLENCMKAHGACMDDGEAEKVLKALGVTAEKKDAPAATLSADDMKKMIDEAVAKAVKEGVEKAIGELPEPSKVRKTIDRDGKEKVVEMQKVGAAADPFGDNVASA